MATLFVLYIVMTGGQHVKMLTFHTADDCRHAADAFNAALPSVQDAVSKAVGAPVAYQLNDISYYACAVPTS